jgi:hypothetical protein
MGDVDEVRGRPRSDSRADRRFDKVDSCVVSDGEYDKVNDLAYDELSLKEYTFSAFDDEEAGETIFWTRSVMTFVAELLFDKTGIKEVHSLISLSGFCSFNISIRISSTSLRTRAIFSSNVSSLSALSTLDV